MLDWLRESGWTFALVMGGLIYVAAFHVDDIASWLKSAGL